MVAGAFLNDFTKGIAEGIGNLFNQAGIGGRSIDGNDSGGGGGGNLLSDLITRVLDPDSSNNSGSSGGGGLGDTIKNVILDNLTVENLNTFKGLLRGYWNQHKGHEEAEVRKDLDILRKQLGNEGMAGRLAKTIECIEEDISDEMCDTSESFAFDAKAPNFMLMLLCAFFVLAIVHMVLKRRV